MNEWISVLRARFYNVSHWVRRRILVLRKRFYNASHIEQVWLIIGLLYTLSLPFYLFVPTSLMEKISAGIFFGPLIVHYLWRDRYPAIMRWIREREYRRQMSVLCERFCQASRPNKFYSVGVAVIMLLVPIILLAAAHLRLAPSLSFLLLMIVASISYGVCTLGFIDEVWHEWYPALKQKPGMGYIFLAMNFILGVAAYALAYEYINFLTGVDPGKFLKALTVFTAVAIVPVWTMGIAMIASIIAIGSMVALPVIDMLSSWHIIGLWSYVST